MKRIAILLAALSTAAVAQQATQPKGGAGTPDSQTMSVGDTMSHSMMDSGKPVPPASASKPKAQAKHHRANHKAQPQPTTGQMDKR